MKFIVLELNSEHCHTNILSFEEKLKNTLKKCFIFSGFHDMGLVILKTRFHSYIKSNDKLV